VLRPTRLNEHGADRIARSTEHLLRTVKALRTKGVSVTVRFLDQPELKTVVAEQNNNLVD
jgi:hypothetical protein